MNYSQGVCYRQAKGDRLAYGSQYTHLTIGYAALVIGSLAEGETVTLLEALRRIRGY